MNPQQLRAISALGELDRAGLDYEFASETEVKVLCPFHADKNPSCSINVQKNLFKCYASGCGAKGDLLTFLAKALETTRRVVWADLSKRYELEEVKVIDSSAVERWHQAIWTAKPFLNQLHERGVTNDMVRKYRLGFDGKRITIPVYNRQGMCVNVRCYLPGAPGPDKMRNKRGHGKPLRLYPIEQLEHETVVVCGGEMKAVAVAERLNEHGIGAVTVTAGEGNWDARFNEHFKNKKVYVCFDVDDAGVKASNAVCARLKATAQFVGLVELPLSRDAYPKGDVNDYFGKEARTGEDFLGLLEATEEWAPTFAGAVELDDFVTDVKLAEASMAKYTGRRIRLSSNVAAMDTAPYVIPKKVKVLCDRSQDGCTACPVFATTPNGDGAVDMELHPESPAVIEMVATSKNSQRDALMEGLHVPQCKVVDFIPKEYFNVEDVRLSPQLEISSRTVDDILQPAFVVGHGLETNETYDFVGRMYPNPKTQQSVLLISEVNTAQDALGNYSPTKLEYDELRAFQPDEWTLDALTAKLDQLYDDLAANVTRIFQRQPLHLMIDLAYHSVLLFKFDRNLVKGWVETLVAGDSSQGKSETAVNLMQHYGLGERIECKNATVAGLLGGLQQVGNRWFVTWGVLPKHDRRIVIMEEVKGTSVEVLAKLTDMRSSGIAEIPKIEKRRTHARTRLVMISNPRSDKPLSMYNFGIEAVRELIGSPEDIRRFDATLLVSSNEIKPELLNELQTYRPDVPHLATAELCHRLVLWAWTRSHEQVKFEEPAYRRVLAAATEMCGEFSEIVPIVDRGSMRYKLARLAIALACRTFSNERRETVLVRQCHVEYVVNFLVRTYSSDVFGYKDFSTAVKIHEELIDEGLLKKRVLETPFPSDFIKQMLYTNEIELRDICDWCGWDRNEGLQLLSTLVRKHALARDGRSYRKTSNFIKFLKDLLESPEITLYERPGFVKEEEF